ncbi:MAG: sulfatase-like hydrolase/transferase [Pirellulales bacterium]
MNRLRVLVCLLCLAPPLWAAAAEREVRPPNIVVILIDDLGYADIGPFGATKQRTPQLDRMAREGMKLTSFYAAPVCSVSRAQVLTGCYGARVSVPGVYGPGAKQGLHPQEVTIAERLRERGYATMCIGKWHVGDQAEFLPTRQGFDHYFGLPYSNDMIRASADSGKRVVPLLRDEQVVELLTEEQQSGLVERYTAEAVGFIRAQREKPFFLYLPHTAVHTPIWPGDKFRGQSANGRFGDWVEEVDASVGRILDTLRDLQLAEQTLVVFTSDNGPWLIKGADGGSALPLRGGKGTTWEGGVRVPTLAWWPGHIAGGSSCDAVAGTIDLLPTAVALAGGRLPPEPVIDGRDLSPLLLGLSKTSPREAHFYFSAYNLQAVRQGPWKLAVAAQPATAGQADASESQVTPRLYNLDEEIGEVTNVAAQHPEVVAKLRALAERMQAEIAGNSPTARRPPGEVADARPLYAMAPEAPRKKTERRQGAETATPAKPADLAKLRIGDSLAGPSAPQVAGRAFTIQLQVVTEARDGILLAHGGSAVGYALHLRDGQLVFSTRDRGQQHHVATAFPPAGQPQRIKASLDAAGVMRLQVGDGAVVQEKCLGLLSRQPQEDFCLGRDDGAPVTDYAPAAPLRGQISELRFTSP